MLNDKLGVRHVQALLLAGGLIITHMQQGNLGIAVVAMSQTHSELSLRREEYERANKYDWNKDKVSVITGSFFYSVIVSNIVAAFCVTKLNNKWLLLGFCAAGTLASYLTPLVVAIFEWEAFFFVRLIQGATQGFVKPAIYTLMTRWFPKEEIMLIGPLILSGIYIGVGSMMCMGGYLGTGRGGWPSIFYFAGNCGLIWCIAYAGLGSENPNTSFFISKEERKYLNENIPKRVLQPKRRKVPWLEIIKNRPLYAAMTAQMASNWGYQIFVKLVPIFYQEKMGLSLDLTGLISGLGFAVLFLNVLIVNAVIRYWKRRKSVNYAILRHVCNAIGQFGAFYCFLLCSFSPDMLFTTTMHHLGILVTAFQLHGYFMNYYDLSPTYAGVLIGLGSALSHSFSILGPHVAIMFYQNYENDIEAWYIDKDFIGWRRVYDLISLTYFIGGTTFLFFGKTEVQPFDSMEK